MTQTETLIPIFSHDEDFRGNQKPRKVYIVESSENMKPFCFLTEGEALSFVKGANESPRHAATFHWYTTFSENMT